MVFRQVWRLPANDLIRPIIQQIWYLFRYRGSNGRNAWSLFGTETIVRINNKNLMKEPERYSALISPPWRGADFQLAKIPKDSVIHIVSVSAIICPQHDMHTGQHSTWYVWSHPHHVNAWISHIAWCNSSIAPLYNIIIHNPFVKELVVRYLK